jgi:hypothetical protein
MLLAREDVSVVAAVERLAGLQAQEPRPPFIGLWTRVEGFERDALVDALRSGEVVRGLLMRATLHVVSARNFRAFRPAVQPVLSAAFAGVNKRITGGVDVDEVVPAARELLDESPRTFNELRALLSERFPDPNHRGLGYAARTHLPLTMVGAFHATHGSRLRSATRTRRRTHSLAVIWRRSGRRARPTCRRGRG